MRNILGAVLVTLMLGLAAARGGDVAVRLDSADGSSSMVVYDSASNVLSAITSAGDTVGGGYGNAATGVFATVSGGCWNGANGYGSTVGGGGGRDTVNARYTGNEARGVWSTVGGGFQNLASGDCSVIAGGGGYDAAVTNFVGNTAGGPFGVVGGGVGNLVGAAAYYATIGGGYYNSVTGSSAVVAGGYGNSAAGAAASVGGGAVNTAGGTYATVPGGVDSHASGNYSLAAGRGALATNQGAFVWADSTAAYVASSANNQFAARASGGVVFYSDAGATVGVRLPAGGNSWSAVSDRALKEHVVPVDPQETLERVAAMPVSSWNMKTQDPSIRHLGPMAQDFYAAFGLGETNTMISYSDAAGVSFAAIQGLHRQLREAQDENRDLRRDVGRLSEHLRALEARLDAVDAGGTHASE